MTRVFNFSAGPAALPEPVLRQAADEMLDWHGIGHVGDGDEPPRQGVHRHPRRGRGRCCASCWRMPVELQGAVPAGRRHRPERHRADEPAARQGQRRLHRHRRVVEEVDQGSEEVRQGQRRRQRRGRAATPACRRSDTWKLDPNAAYVHICSNETIGGVRVPLDARHRRRAAGGRHVVEHPVAPDRREPLRPDLRRRAEEHRARPASPSSSCATT